MPENLGIPPSIEKKTSGNRLPEDIRETLKDASKIMEQISSAMPTYHLPKTEYDLSHLQPDDRQKGNRIKDFYLNLLRIVKEFEDKLDPEHEVGMRLVTFGQGTFHVQDIDYVNPSVIRFKGQNDDGTTFELVQHVSQISFLLMAVGPVDGKEPRRICSLVDREEIK